MKPGTKVRWIKHAGRKWEVLEVLSEHYVMLKNEAWPAVVVHKYELREIP